MTAPKGTPKLSEERIGELKKAIIADEQDSYYPLSADVVTDLLALLDQRLEKPATDAGRAEMVEWIHNIGKDANFSEGYDDTDWAMLNKIKAALLSPRKVTSEFITEFARSLIGRTTAERVDLLRDLFAEVGLEIQEGEK